jgi:glucosylceramidase
MGPTADTPAVDMPSPDGAGGAPTTPEGAGGTPVTPEPEPEPEPEPTLVTSGEGSYWNVGEVMEMPGGNASVTVNVDQKQQRWDGFGGTFNEVGWDQLSKLPEEKQKEAMRLLFSSRDGAGFTYGRIPVGSSDYGVSRYSLNDVQSPDYEMAQFSIERDQNLLIPYIKAALDVKPDIKFWASPAAGRKSAIRRSRLR